MDIVLNDAERALLVDEAATRGQGGYQTLLTNLQAKMSPSGDLQLSDEDLERIPRYAFDYGNGGWEDRLKRIFERNLGPSLGR